MADIEDADLQEWWQTTTSDQRHRMLADNAWMRDDPRFANTATPASAVPGGVTRPPRAEVEAAPSKRRLTKRNNEEARLVRDIIEAAHLHGWLCYHQRPARTATGYRTALQGDAGFPDLVLVHPVRYVLVIAETKSQKGKLTLAQQRWHSALYVMFAHAIFVSEPLPFQIIYQVWRPSDWPQIVKVLEGK